MCFSFSFFFFLRPYFGSASLLLCCKFNTIQFNRDTQVTGDVGVLSSVPIRLLDLSDTSVFGNLSAIATSPAHSELFELSLDETDVVGDIGVLRSLPLLQRLLLFCCEHRFFVLLFPSCFVCLLLLFAVVVCVFCFQNDRRVFLFPLSRNNNNNSLFVFCLLASGFSCSNTQITGDIAVLSSMSDMSLVWMQNRYWHWIALDFDLDLIGFDWTGLNWILVRLGLDWIELEWNSPSSSHSFFLTSSSPSLLSFPLLFCVGLCYVAGFFVVVCRCLFVCSRVYGDVAAFSPMQHLKQVILESTGLLCVFLRYMCLCVCVCVLSHYLFFKSKGTLFLLDYNPFLFYLSSLYVPPLPLPKLTSLPSFPSLHTHTHNNNPNNPNNNRDMGQHSCFPQQTRSLRVVIESL